ncbi:hyccin isoform X1 [Phlebotomus argentipes]|uniref:hyccin isoform X1 n=1 Tax=Phlebotomus argentipes TaxID=94469 RepID=UPI002892FFD9|nr:hyccin isoform X1 [Phlebotomus argentipes]
MAESLVADWIADYSSLDASEIRTFAAQHEHNHEISSALFSILNERHKYSDLLHSICNQFYSFYKSSETELRRFTLQFVPILIYNYLNAVSQGDKKSCRSVEMLLLVIYNIEISNEDGQPRVVSFRMPVLAQASIYHEEKSLHATDLRRWEENCNRDVSWGPMPELEHLNAQNRLRVMTALMFVYNQQLSQIQKPALYHLCRTASQLVNQGFSRVGHAHRASYGTDPNATVAMRPLPRIPVSGAFLLELLQAVYFAMFNEFASVAIQTIEDIHNRACFEMFPDTILVTNAVKNSLHVNPSGQPSDGPMGISVALTPSQTTVTVSKSMITNASFRAKKLPDDIPIQAPKDEGGAAVAASAGLVSITEESPEGGEPQLSRGSAVRSSNPKSHKVPFAAGFKKLKEKDKDKDKEVGSKAVTKNGSVELKEVQQPSKKSALKEKIASARNASLHIVQFGDTTTDGDKSPNLATRTKSLAAEVGNGPVEGVMTNGGDAKAETIVSDSLENTESVDSGTDMTMASSSAPSIEAKMQISQV